jgi:hypothetical protein
MDGLNLSSGEGSVLIKNSSGNYPVGEDKPK